MEYRPEDYVKNPAPNEWQRRQEEKADHEFAEFSVWLEAEKKARGKDDLPKCTQCKSILSLRRDRGGGKLRKDGSGARCQSCVNLN